MWEAYRYDPLGRRILVHSNRNHLCGGSEAECTSHVTRMVWSGDQLLWELRARAGVHDDPDAESTSGELYGVVSYTHATGIDRPLAIHKRGQPVIIPHENWRGQFARGTYTDGRVSDCPESSSVNCTRVAWPGYRTTAWHMEAKAPDVVTWYGGLVDGMRDASGQMYMRNRYYDPATGQFTQPDPIGLAGGLNAYGFAAGDPVSYADPYGLKADSVTYLSAEVKAYVDELRAADQEFDAGMQELENDVNFMYVFETGGLMGGPATVWDPVLPQNRLNPGDVQTRLPIVSLMFDWSHIPALNERIAGLSGGPVTRQMVVGHEVYVHAVPFSRSGGRDGCDDNPHSSPDTCGRRRHNELGSRLGWPIREGW